MSDSNMGGRSGIVVGTAGHIDHGKTSLIGALTGIDTDRLAEEKKRGISIDLGFAHLTLPSGAQVSFVDVPGHERFIRNMLAGAVGIEAVLLIVAANEGIKPQTIEHFDICCLLGIKRGIVVLTKSDLATDEQLSNARSAVQHLIRDSFLEKAPVIAVSAATGAGLECLTEALEQLAVSETAREASGFARLPLDRSFSLKGFGTVVTGTLWSGSLRVGETVELQPTRKSARVRGLQVHGVAVEKALAGQRTAVNLSGVEHSDVKRGFVLLRPPGLETTRFIHASVRWLAGAPADPRADFLLHIGTSEVPTRIRILSPEEGASSFIQLNLLQPVLALPGDSFVLRRPSPSETIGGGIVIDAGPPRRLGRIKTASRLRRLASADLPERLEVLVEERSHGRHFKELVPLCGKTLEEIRSAVLASSSLLLVEPAQRVVNQAWLTEKRASTVQFLRSFHERNPSALGAPVAQVRLGLDQALWHFICAGFAAVRLEGDLISLAGHKPEVSRADAAALLGIEQAFQKGGYQPPAPSALPRNLLERLIKSGKLVRVSQELIFHADVIAHLRNSLAAHKGRRFSVPEFKNWMQVSRKYAIPLLEYLDHQRVTRRDGDNRVVL